FWLPGMSLYSCHRKRLNRIDFPFRPRNEIIGRKCCEQSAATNIALSRSAERISMRRSAGSLLRLAETRDWTNESDIRTAYVFFDRWNLDRIQHRSPFSSIQKVSDTCFVDSIGLVLRNLVC